MATGKPNSVLARDIMAKRLVTLHPEVDVFQAIEILVKNKISGAPVVDENMKLLGVFSEKCCMQVLIDAASISLSKSPLQVLHVTRRGVKDASIECDSRLRLSELLGIGRREQTLEHSPIITRRRNVDTKRVSR